MATNKLKLEEWKHVTASTRWKTCNGGKFCKGMYARENVHPFLSAGKHTGTGTKYAENVARVSSRLPFLMLLVS